MGKLVDLLKRYFDVLDVYHKGGGSIRRLVDVEPQSKVTIKKIESGEEIKVYLDDLGVKEGEELRVLEQAPKHDRRGAISLSTDGREVVLGHGMAEKIYLEDKEGIITSLLKMEIGHDGNSKAFGAGRDFVWWISQLGIKVGKEIKFLSHLPDDILSFEIEGKLVPMREAQASKILPEHEGKTVQINFLEIGQKAKVISINGGAAFIERLEKAGTEEGTEITFSKRASITPTWERKKYVRAKAEGQQINISYAMAKKIWVD